MGHIRFCFKLIILVFLGRKYNYYKDITKTLTVDRKCVELEIHIQELSIGLYIVHRILGKSR